MPDTKEGLVIIIGALFLLIGVVGGGLELSALKIPAVGKVPRILSLCLGALLLVIGLVLYLGPDGGGEVAQSDMAPASSPSETSAPSDGEEESDASAKAVDSAVDCSSLSSPESQESATLILRNDSSRTVDVYWVYNKGAEEHKFSLSPGQVKELATYVTHSWCIRDADSEEALTAVTISEDNETVSIP